MPAAYQTANDTVPAKDGVVVVPSDVTILPTFRYLYVGVTGNIAVCFPSGNTITHKNVPVGQFNVQGTQVLATGTTASEIIAWY